MPNYKNNKTFILLASQKHSTKSYYNTPGYKNRLICLFSAVVCALNTRFLAFHGEESLGYLLFLKISAVDTFDFDVCSLERKNASE